MHIPRNLGLLLGVVGLSAFTIEFAFSNIATSLYALGVVAAWFFYFLFALPLRREKLLGLLLGLSFLIVLPVTIMTYDSASRLTDTIVGATRNFSPANDSVTLSFTFEIYSSFNPLPATVNDMSFTLTECCYTTINSTSVKGGTLNPFGNLRYNLTFLVTQSFVDLFRGNITALDLFGSATTVQSGLFTEPFYYGFHGYWNWFRNVPCDYTSTGPKCP